MTRTYNIPEGILDTLIDSLEDSLRVYENRKLSDPVESSYPYIAGYLGAGIKSSLNQMKYIKETY